MRRPKVVRDPVCGKKISIKQMHLTVLYNGRAYIFCSKKCKTEFENDPEEYANQNIEH
jgi:YHS domain-containing protein